MVLTPRKPVPREWFGDLSGKDVLGLARRRGEQGPRPPGCCWGVDDAFDNSPFQLDQDRKVAEREGLSIRLVEGDMRDLSAFANESFDLIFDPCSNVFVNEVRPVWREAFRGRRGPAGRCCRASATRSSSCSTRTWRSRG